MPITRRDVLLTMISTPLSAPVAWAAESQGKSETELIVCGWDEVFILVIGEGPTPTYRKAWSWHASDSLELPADMHALFRTTDDCKPVDGGRKILISSSGGAVALVDRETRRASFFARITNAHSIEMLPGGRIAGAASVSNDGMGNRLAIFDGATGRELASDALRSAHCECTTASSTTQARSLPISGVFHEGGGSGGHGVPRSPQAPDWVAPPPYIRSRTSARTE